jgi:hypothetical protein
MVFVKFGLNNCFFFSFSFSFQVQSKAEESNLVRGDMIKHRRFLNQTHCPKKSGCSDSEEERQRPARGCRILVPCISRKSADYVAETPATLGRCSADSASGWLV